MTILTTLLMPLCALDLGPTQARTDLLSGIAVVRRVFTRVSEPPKSGLGADQIVAETFRQLRAEIFRERPSDVVIRELARFTVAILRRDPVHFAETWRGFVEDLIYVDGDAFARAVQGLSSQTVSFKFPAGTVALINELGSRANGGPLGTPGLPIFIRALRLDRQVRAGAALPGPTYADDVLEHLVDFANQQTTH